MQQDMFVLKDDALGTIYTRNAALGYVREIPQDLRGKGGFAGDVEIRYLWGSSDWLSDADWARIKPLVVAGVQASQAAEISDLEGELKGSEQRLNELEQQLERAQARIKELEQGQVSPPLPKTLLGLPIVYSSDLPTGEIVLGDFTPDAAASALTPAPTTFEAEMQAEETAPAVSIPDRAIPHVEISPNAAPSRPWKNVVRVKRTTFYSTTTRSNRAQWTCYTDDGLTVNLFDHSDPTRDHKSDLEGAGYLSFFQLMKVGQNDSWKTHPIRMEIKQSGKFWNLVAIAPREADAAPDELGDELTPAQLKVCREAKALLTRDDLRVFDCETTGLQDDDEVVEISAVTADGVYVLTSYIRPVNMANLRRPGKKNMCSVDIHGIDEQTLALAPRLSDAFTQQLIEKALGGRVWAAFNISFDVRLLTQSWTIAKAAAPFPMAADTVDVQQLTNIFFGHDYTSVDEVCRKLNITRTTTHRATADAMDTLLILQALAAKVPTEIEPF